MVATESTPVQAVSNSPTSTKQVSPSKPPLSHEELKAEAMDQLNAGRKHLLLADYPLAVSALAESCEILSKQFGETAVECAEPYFYYGKALLELSRLEAGVLGNALKGVPDKDDVKEDAQIEDPEKLTEKEREEVEETVGDALEDNHVVCSIFNEKSTGDLDAETTEDDSAEEEESYEGEAAKEDSEKEDAKDSKKEAKSDEQEMKEAKQDQHEMEVDPKPEDAEEDPSNLQLAWEVLELAKLAFTKQAEATAKGAKEEGGTKLCDTLLLLGEVSMENENYEQAVEDLNTCLKKRQETLPIDKRALAQTHYQLGIALGFHQKFEEAEESLKKAIDVLEERVKDLKEATEEVLKKEVKELEALIPEIKEKIVDNEEMKKRSLEMMTNANKNSGISSSSSSGDASSVPTSSISVKRKSSDSGAETKKAKPDSIM